MLQCLSFVGEGCQDEVNGHGKKFTPSRKTHHSPALKPLLAV